MKRVILIECCTACPHCGHKGAFGEIRYIPHCHKKGGKTIPYDVSASTVNGRPWISASPKTGVPSWCPLPKVKDDGICEAG